MRPEDRAYERRWWILVVLCFSLLVIVLDNSILNVAIPTLQRELGATTSQLQWIVDAYTLVFAGLLLTMGSLGDRFGRRGALQVGLTLFGIGSLASALAKSPEQLIATRGFMGIGGALIMPATLSIITNTFPSDERGRAIGAWAGVAGVGIALGPLTGGFLLEHFYWGSVFLVNLPIVAIGLAAGVFLIPTSKDPSTPPLDPVGAALSIAGLTALLYGIIEAPIDGWTDPSILIAFGLAVVLIGAFVVWELRTPFPMLDVNFFRNPRFTAASSGITLVFFAMFGSLFLLTQYMQLVLGYSPLEAGVRLLPFAFVMMVTAPASARVVEAIGTKITVTLGLSFAALALALMATLSPTSSYGDLVWRLMVLALGLGLTMAPATDSIMGSLPLAKAGVGSAVNDTTRMVGGSLGVAVIGSALTSSYNAKVDSVAAAHQLSAATKEAMRSSLYGALSVAERLPGPIAKLVTGSAKDAFVTGMHRGVLIGAGASVVGAVIAVLWLPARARAADEVEQRQEYAAEHAGEIGFEPTEV